MSAMRWPAGLVSLMSIPGLMLFHKLSLVYKRRALMSRNTDMLLTKVGNYHPQALIFVVTVASQSSSMSRKNAAQAIMDRMRDHIASGC